MKTPPITHEIEPIWETAEQASGLVGLRTLVQADGSTASRAALAKSGSAGTLSFDDAYAYQFGQLSPEQRTQFEAQLDADPTDRAYAQLMEGLPSLTEALDAGQEILPADLKPTLFAELGVGAARPTAAGLTASGRLSRAAWDLLEQVRGSADAMVLLMGQSLSAAVEVLTVPELLGEPTETAVAYDVATSVAEPVPAALEKLPRVRVQHGTLCMALSNERPPDLRVALIDPAGAQVAVAAPNHIGVVTFDKIAPGVYGVKLVSA